MQKIDLIQKRCTFFYLGLMLGIVGMTIAYLLSNLAKTGYFVCQDLQIKSKKN